MDDMTAFEQQVESVLRHAAGPSRPVDAVSIVETATTDRWTVITRRLRRSTTTPTDGGSPMFSALKYIAAGVILALFGGFLLSGFPATQEDQEIVPATVTDEVLPGVTLGVEEVESGVYRVVNDGVRDLVSKSNGGIVAGHDGGIWLLRPQRFLRLGSEEAHAWPTKKPEVAAFEVAPDGTVWAMLADEEGRDLYSVGRGSDDWTPTTFDPLTIEVTADGTVWALWRDDPEDPKSTVFGYLGADGWQSVGESPDWHGTGCSNVGRCFFLVSDRGDIWTGWYNVRNWRHFVDGAWRTYDGLDDLRGSIWDAAVGADGTVWGSARQGFFRFDGTEWTTFERHDGFSVDVYGLGESHVAPDGSLWVAPEVGECGRDGCDCDDGVARFDGMSWGRYLPDLCVRASDITADGSVWLLASDEVPTTYDPDQQAWGPDVNTTWDLYVITPEAVAGAE